MSWPFLGIHKSQIKERRTPLDLIQFCSSHSTCQPTILFTCYVQSSCYCWFLCCFWGWQWPQEDDLFWQPSTLWESSWSYSWLLVTLSGHNPLLAELSWANKGCRFRSGCTMGWSVLDRCPGMLLKKRIGGRMLYQSFTMMTLSGLLPWGLQRNCTCWTICQGCCLGLTVG